MTNEQILIICPTARTAEHYRRVRIDASKTAEEATRWQRARVITTSRGFIAVRGYRDIEPWFIEVPDSWNNYQSIMEMRGYFDRIGVTVHHDNLDNWIRHVRRSP